LAQWLGRPHVQQWWREPSDLTWLEKSYGPSIDGTDRTEIFIAEMSGEPVGMAQRYLLDDEPSWKASLAPSGNHENAAGIDYLLGEEHLIGHGLGPLMIASFLASTWARYPHISEVVVSVDQGNRRSWRALEKIGFRRIWTGDIVSDDPSDEGPSYVYTLARPQPP
jgi:aminoglycoside 6'-N-acetyltransferase